MATSVARVIGVGFAAILLWHALFAVLAADRGLDLTDEGLYLLAAQPPSLEAAWGTPAGWHTAPLFRAVGYDVAAFRTLGAFLLVVFSGALGLLAVRVGRSVRERELVDRRKGELVFGAAMGGLAGLLYYGGLLRTPSYNWVTVFGATVAAVGLLQIVVSQLQQHKDSLRSGRKTSRWRLTPYMWGVVIAGFGAFFTVPAKPTTPIFFAALAIPILGLAGGRRFVIRTLLLITGTSLGFLIAAVILGLWPMRFVSIFVEAVTAPSLLPTQSLGEALLTIPRFPLDLMRDFRTLTAILVAMTFVLLSIGRSRTSSLQSLLDRRRVLAVASLVVLVVYVATWWAVPALVAFVHALPADGWSGLVMGNRATYPAENYVVAAQSIIERFAPMVLGPATGLLLLVSSVRWRAVIIVAAVVGLLETNHRLLLVTSGETVQTEFVRAELTRGTFVVAIGVLLLAVAHHFSPAEAAGRWSWRGWRGVSPLLAVLGLWLFGVATGFGSGHGLIRQGALAAGILVPALLLGAATVREGRERVVAGMLIGALVLPTTVLHVLNNFRAPYRMEPMLLQTVRVPVGVDGASLLLDEDLARLLVGITEAASIAGWAPRDPLLAVASRWSSTISWHLGATVPDSLMLTIGGYGSLSDDRLDFNLDRHVDQRFRAAWILVTAETHQRREESKRWAQDAASHVGRSFPEDYVLVLQAQPGSSRWVNEYGLVELWRPKAS